MRKKREKSNCDDKSNSESERKSERYHTAGFKMEKGTKGQEIKAANY